MIQSSQVMNSIGKQRLAHSNPIQRSLRNICYDASLSEQFADISTGVVIPVHNQSTGLTNIGFVNFSRFIQSSTSATELRSMIRIDFGKSDDVFFTQTRERMKEFSIRNFVNNFIDFSSFGVSNFSSNPKIFQIFNNNSGISIGFVQINNFMSQFPATIFNKIIFISFQSFKGLESFLTSQISKSLKFRFSSFNDFSFDKHLFSKIEMSKKFLFFGIINRDSNIISICVYSNNLSTFNRISKILFDKNLNSEIFEQKNRTNLPTTNKIFSQSQISTIPNNWEINSFAFGISSNRNNKQTLIIGFYGEHSFIKPDWNRFNFFTNFSSQENLEQRSLNKSRLQFIFFSEIFINHRLEFISANPIIEFPNFKDFFRTSKIFVIQFRDFGFLSNCRFSDIDCNYFLHRNYKKSNNQSFINLYIPQFIPHINGGDFLREELNFVELERE